MTIPYQKHIETTLNWIGAILPNGGENRHKFQKNPKTLKRLKIVYFKDIKMFFPIYPGDLIL